MNKLNWIKYSDHKPNPKYDDELILVVIKGSIGLMQYEEDGFYIMNSDDSKDHSDDNHITHFLHIRNIPLPEEEL